MMHPDSQFQGTWDPEQSVWDEPAIRATWGPPPQEVWTYGRWVQWQREQFPAWKSYLLCVLVALLSGPWGVLGTLLGVGNSGALLLAGALGAPVLEEVMKAALPYWVARKRPWWFRSPGQILFTMAASGLIFAAIENLLYLFVYVPNPPDWLVLWRWTVCVGLHVLCTLLSGWGVVRLWKQSVQEGEVPHTERFLPWLVAAILVHLVYNLAALMAQWLGVLNP